jgi:hypothetical protein
VQMHVSRAAVAQMSDGSGAVVSDGHGDGAAAEGGGAVPLGGNAQFTIRQTDIDGFARLDAGVLGRVYSSISFSRNPENMVRRCSVPTPHPPNPQCKVDKQPQRIRTYLR